MRLVSPLAINIQARVFGKADESGPEPVFSLPFYTPTARQFAIVISREDSADLANTSTSSAVVSRTPQGILCILTGMVLFAGQDAMMKLLIGPYTVWLLIGVRAVITAIILISLTPVGIRLAGDQRPRYPLKFDGRPVADIGEG